MGEGWDFKSKRGMAELCSDTDMSFQPGWGKDGSGGWEWCTYIRM